MPMGGGEGGSSAHCSPSHTDGRDVTVVSKETKSIVNMSC